MKLLFSKKQRHLIYSLTLTLYNQNVKKKKEIGLDMKTGICYSLSNALFSLKRKQQGKIYIVNFNHTHLAYYEIEQFPELKKFKPKNLSVQEY